MKIRYALSYPLFMDKGGGVTHAFEEVSWLKKLGHQVEPLDWYSENMDFDVLFLFGFTHFNPEVLALRKNQIILVKALKSTGIKLVLTGCGDIEEKIKDEFLELIKGDPNIICLPFLDKKMLISAYKNARVVVFPSLAETAGIVAIEGGYLGCRLVLSDIPIFREYFLDYPIYVNNKDPEDIRKKVLKALNEDYDPSSFREFLLKNRSWEAHAKIVNSVLGGLYESRK
jgi:glycosyltransferase involved in cell wall biosynthesis